MVALARSLSERMNDAKGINSEWWNHNVEDTSERIPNFTLNCKSKIGREPRAAVYVRSAYIPTKKVVRAKPLFRSLAD